jgi:tRNA(Ile)-lysidine synthase
MVGRESRIIQHLRRSWRLAGEPSSVVLGYSGGADSLALLVLLHELVRLEPVALLAVHVDHVMRPESADEAEVVRQNAESLGVPIVVERLVERVLDRHAGVGLEEAMRRERYAVLARVAGEREAVVAVAHHRRDQAETVLLHLMRGASLGGMAGMREVSHLVVPWWESGAGTEVTIWRPLLAVPGDEVRAVARGTGLPLVDDPSNFDEGLRRNAIRHRVLPVLESVSPGVEETLARFAGLAAVDADELDGQAIEALDTVRSGDDLVRNGVLALRPAIRNRVLRMWLLSRLPVGCEVSANRIEALVDVAERPGPVRLVQIASGWSVEVSREWLRLVHGDESQR